MSRFLWGPFISDKIQKDNSDTKDNLLQLIEDQNLDFINDKNNFHLTENDEYFFGINIFNKFNYTFGNDIDKQLLENIIDSDILENNEIYFDHNQKIGFKKINY